MDVNISLQVGTSILIKRTDGRVHSAIVAAIDSKAHSASVEWYEQGETKGKEINLTDIEALNPNIPIFASIANHKKPNDVETESKQTLPGNLTSKTTNGKGKKESRCTIGEISSSFGSVAVPSRIQRRITQVTNGQDHSNDEVYSGQIDLPTRQPDREETNSTNISSVQNPRKRNVVKEVEKLKRNREERRLRQAEEKAEKEAFLQLAPGNPHWELLNMIQEYQKTLDIKPLTENDPIEENTITVCVRKRPLNRKELQKKVVDVITIPSKNQLIVHEPKTKVDLTRYLDNQLFRFDYAFDETCTNQMVYKFTAQPLVKTIFEGGFATCFAYGQTGSGKTHTMGGDFTGKVQHSEKGIYAMATADVFGLAKSPKYRHLNLVVSTSFFEIYSGKVFDLLNNKAKLRILEDGKQQVQVVGLTEKVVSSTEEVLKFIHKGNQARTSGQTSANANSSRSHAIFQIIIRAAKSVTKVHGKFSLIDLAGNERGADTSSANRQTRMEGAEINKSLLALKECIRALGRQGGQHVPFRVSKLTQVLRDSFVGDKSRTCMIAMISPGVSSCEHTINTLRYADRVKELGGGNLLCNQADDEYGKDETEDLIQLQSLNENDMSPELLNFHKVVSELQIAEENMVEYDRECIGYLKSSCQELEEITRITDSVNFDPEAYYKKKKACLNQIMSVIEKTNELTTEFMKKLAAEEQLSHKIKHK